MRDASWETVMRLSPQEPVIPELGGFTDENDLFDYRGYADRLTNLICNVDEPLVIALDGPWGSGKSTFVKQWAGLLRARGASVVVFDAFSSDYYEDAFLALSAEIYELAKNVLGGNETTARRFLNRAKKAGTVLAPIASRIASRVGSAGILSLEDVEASSAALKATVKALGDESAKAVERVISERIRRAGDERAALDAFRETLSEISQVLAAKNREAGEGYPLIFLIDDLDRCRPPFALSVIERIKHLFAVPGTCFVLVTYLPQLEKVVQGAYGTTFDAHLYLEKFYNIRVVLPKNRENRGIHRTAYLQFLWKSLGIEFSEYRVGELIVQELLLLAEVYDLSLRTLERVMTHVALVCAAIGPRHLVIPPLLAGLCVMRQTHPALYAKARAEGLNWREAKGFLQPPEQSIDTEPDLQRFGVNREWTLDWWKYATGGELPDEKVQRIGQSIAQYHIQNRFGLIPIFAGYIDELIQRQESA